MEKKLTRTYHTLPVMNLKLIPIVETSLGYWQDRAGVSVFAKKQPIGVVVISSSGRRVITVTGEEIPLEQFFQEYPDISVELGQI
jgi:hypothetical protein